MKAKEVEIRPQALTKDLYKMDSFKGETKKSEYVKKVEDKTDTNKIQKCVGDIKREKVQLNGRLLLDEKSDSSMPKTEKELRQKFSKKHPDIHPKFLNHLLTSTHTDTDGFLGATLLASTSLQVAHGLSPLASEKTLDNIVFVGSHTYRNIEQIDSNKIIIHERSLWGSLVNTGDFTYIRTRNGAAPILTINAESSLTFDPRKEEVTFKVEKLELSSHAVAPKVTKDSSDTDKALKGLYDGFKPPKAESKQTTSTFGWLTAKLRNTSLLSTSKNKATPQTGSVSVSIKPITGTGPVSTPTLSKTTTPKGEVEATDAERPSTSNPVF